MNKEIVILVPTDAAAYQTVQALKNLDLEGSIELYSSAVVVKSDTGEMSIKDDESMRAPWGTMLGLSTGALIGLLGGPVGAAIGAAVGGAAGLGGDLAYSGFAGEFVADVAARLKPGDHAVVASVWEDWTVPIDLAVGPFGAVVFRQATDDVIVAQIRAEMQALKEEQAHVDAEIKRAAGDAKNKLETKRNELKAKQAAQRDKLQKRAKKLQERWDAEIASINAKLNDAKAEAKVRHQQHVEKLSRFKEQQKESFQQLFA